MKQGLELLVTQFFFPAQDEYSYFSADFRRKISSDNFLFVYNRLKVTKIFKNQNVLDRTVIISGT